MGYEYTEVSAKTVNEAITKACIEMGISSDQLDIEIVSEGSTGFLGFGSKPAVIKVRKKEETMEEKLEKIELEPVDIALVKEVEAEQKAEKIEAEKKEKAAEKKQSFEKKADRPAKFEKPARAEKPYKAAKKDNRRKDYKENAAQPKHEEKEAREIVLERSAEEIVTMKASASKFLDSVFKAMNMNVNITMNYNSETGSLDIEFEGEDMGILIGKRGQTLDSLQYLVSLVVNRDVEDYVRVKLDTEDYRRRRKATLENLANNIARKVKKTRRPVSMEPMNPYERRIIHSALQGNHFVETYSEGSEPYRHVVIAPKRG